MEYGGEIRKYMKFITGGGLGLLINLLVTYALHDITGIWFRLAYATGLGINVAFNFIYHREITFKKKDITAKRFYKFAITTAIIAATNYLLVVLFTEVIIADWIILIEALKQYYNYAIIIAITGIVSVINYAINKLWVFK